MLAVDSRIKALKALLAKAGDKSLEPEIQSELSKLGAVLSCGTLERCIEAIMLERLQRKAHPRVLNFVKAHFKRGTNYDCEAIEQLLARFDVEWGNEFHAYVEANDATKQAVASCYTVRNAIAHGNNHSTSIANIVDYAVEIEKLIGKVELITA